MKRADLDELIAGGAEYLDQASDEQLAAMRDAFAAVFADEDEMDRMAMEAGWEVRGKESPWGAHARCERETVPLDMPEPVAVALLREYGYAVGKVCND